MKKISIVIILLFFGSISYAQEGLKIGVQGGLPFNDFNKDVRVVLGANLGYMWALGEVVDFGIMTGYIYGFPEKYETDNPLIDLPSVQFAPLAASIRIWPSNSFSFGIDAGQAIGLNDGNNGGLYYRPQAGILMGPYTEVNLSYSAIALENKQWNIITLGVLYTLPLKKEF